MSASVRSPALTEVKSGAALSLEFHDGRAAARAAGKPKPRKTARDEDDNGQGSLL